jgi:GNAT superfamily N-acetyltransferase
VSFAVEFSIRRATAGDAALIARHRVGMFSDMGQVPTEALANELLQASTVALAALLREGSYLGWFAIDAQENVLAGAGVHMKPQLPRITHEGRIATAPVPLAVNVYTEPGSRRRGIARALMQAVMTWAKSQGCDRMVLHASDFGRPLYQSLGFSPTNEMRWSIDAAAP